MEKVSHLMLLHAIYSLQNIAAQTLDLHINDKKTELVSLVWNYV